MPNKRYPTKLETLLTAGQIQEVRDWLVKENISYSVLQSRLKEKFGITLSLAGCSAFWHRFCQTTQGTQKLDVVITPEPGTQNAVRVQIFQRDENVTVSPKS